MYWYNTVTSDSNRHDLFLTLEDMKHGKKPIAGFYWNNGYVVGWTHLKDCQLPPVREETDEAKVRDLIVKAILGFVITQSNYYDSLYYYMSRDI